MPHIDFNPPAGSSRRGSNFKRILGGGAGLLVLVVFLAGVWTGLEMYRSRPGPARPGLIGWLPVSKGIVEAKAKGKPILYDFTAAWCPPCRMLEANVFSDAQIAQLINAHFVPVRAVDRVREDGQNPADVETSQRKYGIGAFPTLVAASMDGREYARLEGYHPKSQVNIWLAQVLEAHSLIKRRSPAE